MEKIIFHVDVNSAYLSWEAVERLKTQPDSIDLREIPAAVGGSVEMRHGVVLAKSLPCKKYGIKTGESLMEARKKCPDLLVVSPSSGLYSRYSRAFMDILREYTPDVEQYSIDEAFMDMTGTGSLWGDPVTAAARIKDHIYHQLGFTVNIGISNNKLLAKMASDFQKPNLVHTLFPDEVPLKMWPLPVTDLFSVGKATVSKLQKLGIRTIGDLAKTDVEVLTSNFKSHGQVIWNYANGIDSSDIAHTAPANKGYGNSTTLPQNICDSEGANTVLLSLAETIGIRLRKDAVKIEVVSVTIRYDDFSQHSHQMTLHAPTNITNEIHHASFALFQEIWDKKTPIRLLGIQTSHARDDNNNRQLSLFDLEDSPLFDTSSPQYEKLEKADKMADKIRRIFGNDAIKRAAFLESPDKNEK